MKKAGLASVVLLISLLSCLAGDKSIASRRENAIYAIKKYHLSTKNPVMARAARAVLLALQASSAETLKKPTIGYAYLTRNTNSDLHFQLFWIEGQPSVKAVEFRCSEAMAPVIVPVPDGEIRYNESLARRTVEFTIAYKWEAESDCATKLGLPANAMNLKVRLLDGNKSVTEWFTVDFYNVDKWVTNNQVRKEK